MYRNNFIVAIKHKGKILRENGDEVCLPFGSQYSILLKNKSSRRALVDIEIDGENVLVDQSLIIDGDTSQEIKGFMRDMPITNRFKFIHKTKEISEYRGNGLEDGLISVTYRFEKPPITIEKKQVVPDLNPWIWPYYPPIKYGGSDSVYTSCNYTLDMPTKDFEGTVSMSSDEGITVKGSKITQDYQYGYIGNLEDKSYVITLQLKGITKRKKTITKPLTVKTKLRCSTCGRKSKSSSQFCYNCGTYLR